MTVAIRRPDGGIEQIELNGMALYREAMDKKIPLRKLMNQKYPTIAGGPDSFMQACHSAGLRFSDNDHTGVPAANLQEIFDPAVDATGSYTSSPAVPDSRILFPAALLEVIEDQLQSKEDVATGAFENLIGYRKTITTPRFEQPVVSYSGAQGPEDSAFQRVAQNTRPPIMLSIKAADVSRTVPTTAIGMEISREALQATTLDFVAMTMTRFLKKANYAEWVTQMGLLLSGDPDAKVTTMSAATSALSVVKASAYDSTIVANGVVTQKAWLAFLYANSMEMQKTHMVCDFAAALAIENRTGRPTNVMNNSIDRLDVPFRISYPVFQSSVDLIVMPTGTFTANTVMAIDKSQAIAKVTSSAAEYSAIEEVVMKKATNIRLDRGWTIYRMYDDGFGVLSLIA